MADDTLEKENVCASRQKKNYDSATTGMYLEKIKLGTATVLEKLRKLCGKTKLRLRKIITLKKTSWKTVQCLCWENVS